MLHLTDIVVSKDPPQCIAALPQRVGPRPTIARVYPCLQLTDCDDPQAQERLLRRASQWPGLAVEPPRQNIPRCRALRLDRELTEGQGEAFILADEFAHVRADGSVHAALAPEWAEQVLQRGWGQIHPLALYGLIQPQSLIFFAPRDEHEQEVVIALLQAAYAYACGREAITR